MLTRLNTNMRAVQQLGSLGEERASACKSGTFLSMVAVGGDQANSSPARGYAGFSNGVFGAGGFG